MPSHKAVSILVEQRDGNSFYVRSSNMEKTINFLLSDAYPYAPVASVRLCLNSAVKYHT